MINPSNYILASLNPMGVEESYYSIDAPKSLEVGKENFLAKPNYLYWTNTARGSGGNCWHIGAVGRVSSSQATNSYGIRPVINLNEKCIYKSGNGTLSSPYILDIPKI